MSTHHEKSLPVGWTITPWLLPAPAPTWCNVNGGGFCALVKATRRQVNPENTKNHQQHWRAKSNTNNHQHIMQGIKQKPWRYPSDILWWLVPQEVPSGVPYWASRLTSVIHEADGWHRCSCRQLECQHQLMTRSSTDHQLIIDCHDISGSLISQLRVLLEQIYNQKCDRVKCESWWIVFCILENLKVAELSTHTQPSAITRLNTSSKAPSGNFPVLFEAASTSHHPMVSAFVV